MTPMCPTCRARHLRRVYAHQDELRRRAMAACRAVGRPLSELPRWFVEPMVTELEREGAVD